MAKNNGVGGSSGNFMAMATKAGLSGAVAGITVPFIAPEISVSSGFIPFIGQVSGPVAFGLSVGVGSMISDAVSTYAIPYVPVIGGDTAVMIVPPLVAGAAGSAVYGYTNGYNPAGLLKSTAVGAASQMVGTYLQKVIY